MIGTIPGTDIHCGLVVGIAVCVGAYILIRHTTVGFAARIAGGNMRAARMVGLPIGRLVMLTCVLGGAAAGLAGCGLSALPPGARVPLHRHPGYEHVFVLEGSQSDANGRYPAGSLLISPPGSSHAIVSEEGCIVLVVWERPVILGSSP